MSNSTPSNAAPTQPELGLSALTHLQRIEAESIHILREVVAQSERPVLMYSAGKDSTGLLHLARLAFHPAPPPMPLLHVDTMWKFAAMYDFRDRMAADSGVPLIVHRNPQALAQGINPFDHGSQVHTDLWKTQGLKQALDEHHFDAAIGGARRDEEMSRAKERVFSLRLPGHVWGPREQRPELWRLFNGLKRPGQTLRVFPLSNWTEADVGSTSCCTVCPWCRLYLAAPRPVAQRRGALIVVDDERMRLQPGGVPQLRRRGLLKG